LFLIVAEGLVELVREATKKGLVKYVKIRAKSVEVNLLQFVDDG